MAITRHSSKKWVARHRWKITLVVAIGGLFHLVPSALWASMERVYEVASPSNVGNAIFYSQASIGSDDLTLYVRDYEKSGRTPILIDTLDASDAGINFSNAVWSKDGSVIVVSVTGRRDVTYGPDGYMIGYDFQTHQEIEPPLSGKVLARGGGAGQQIFSVGRA